MVRPIVLTSTLLALVSSLLPGAIAHARDPLPTPLRCLVPPCFAPTELWDRYRALDEDAPTSTPAEPAATPEQPSPTPEQPSSSPTSATSTPAGPGDALENNYDAQHAAIIAVDTAYALDFVCPVTWTGACEGGDHDYLRVPLKADTAYLIATYDITNTDTVLDLYWQDSEQPVLSNDDRYGQDLDRGIAGGVASALHFRAPSDGWATLRVSPRFGAAAPSGQPGAYTVAVARVDSELAQSIERTLAAQAGIPPTPTALPPTAVPAPAAPAPQPAAPAPQPRAPAPAAPRPAAPPPTPPLISDVSAGRARVLTEARLLTAPGGDTVLLTVPRDTTVQLKGQASGIWVRVEVDNGIVPGWVDSRRLERIDTPPASAAATADTGDAVLPAVDPTDSIDADRPAASAPAQSAAGGVRGMGLRITANGPVAAATPVIVEPTARVVDIAMCRARAGATTCAVDRAMAGVRVELLHGATREILHGGRTEASGQIRLVASVPPTTALLLSVPAYGVLIPLPTTPTIALLIPTETTP